MPRRGLQRIVSATISCTPAKTAAVFLTVLFGSLSLLPVAARANYVDVTQTGTIASGTDTSGVFGAPGTDLTGDSYTTLTTYDDTKGVQTVGTCTLPCSSAISYSAATSDPVVSSMITINGRSFAFASYPYNTPGNNTDREIPPSGSVIGEELSFYYTVPGEPPNNVYGGDGYLTTLSLAVSGGPWTTDYFWEDSYSNSTIQPNAGEFSIDRITYSNPNFVQTAIGTLSPLSITVSGSYAPGTGHPPAATTHPAKNNGCPTCNGGTTAVPSAQPAMGAPAQTASVDTANGGGSLFPNAVSAVGVRTVASVQKNSIVSAGSTNTGTGNYNEVETDYVGPAHTQLEMIRVYNSYDTTQGPFGAGWHGTYNRTLSGPTASVVSVTHEDGRVDTYTQSGTNWVPAADVTEILTEVITGGVQTGWQLVRNDDSTELYTLAGQLTSITTRSGLVTTMTYTSGNLTTVTGPFGQTLTYTYNAANRVATMVTPNGDTYYYVYNNAGDLAGVEDPNSGIRSYTYEVPNFPFLLTGIIDPVGSRNLTVAYDTTGRVTSTQHANGADLTTFTYNTGGTVTMADGVGGSRTYTNMTQFTMVKPASLSGTSYPAAGGQAFAYDTNGFISSLTDFDGNITHYVHDTRGNETSRTEAYGTTLARTITTTWHATFHLPLVITEPNRTTTNTYDTHGNLLTKTIVAGSLSRNWTYTYNTSGQVLTAQDPNTNVTTFTYDTHGNLATVKDALLHVTTFTSYDTNGRLLTSTDPNGQVFTYTWDKVGRMLTKTIGGYETQYSYNPDGTLKLATFPDNSNMSYTYDAAQRLTKVTDRLGNYTVYTLDGAGNRTMIQTYDSSGVNHQTHSFTYDAVNRLATDSGYYTGESTAYAYDAQSNLMSVTDPMSHAWTYHYDALNRLHTSADPLGNTTAYGYNANDNLTSVLDPRSLTTTYTVNGLNNQTNVASPDTGATARTFDNAGNVLTSTDARSDVTTYTYDALQRPKTVAYTSGTGITYTYDAGTYGIGHLTSMTDPSGSTVWTYDQEGGVLTKAQTVGTNTLTVTYAYGSGHNLNTLYLPGGDHETFPLDQDGRAPGIVFKGSNLISSATFMPFGSPSSWSQQDGNTYTRTIDQDGRITGISTGTADVQGLTWDTASRLTGLTETGLSNKTFGYDHANKLTSYVNGTATTSYTYDADDNRATQVIAAGTTTYNYPTTSNKLSSLSGHITQTEAYDAAGNQTGDGTNVWAYNARGRMSTVVESGVTTTYLVNGLGQRVSKASTAVPTGQNLYVYDEAGHLIGEYNATGQRIQETVYYGDTPVATEVGTSGVVYSISPDWQNTPHIVANSSGVFAWSWDRAAFGDNAPNTNPGGLGTFTYNPRFPGQLADVEDGLSNNGFRHYNSNTGRYIQSDPAGLSSGINTYGYAAQQPLIFSDPTGRTTIQPSVGEPSVIGDNDALYAVLQNIFGAATPVGSALKDEPYVNAADMSLIKNQAIHCGSYFIIPSNQYLGYSLLLQMDGTMNGTTGVYEWIVPINGDLFEGSPIITHQRFIPNAPVSGYPNNTNGKYPPFGTV